jgi:hypothetical protein
MGDACPDPDSFCCFVIARVRILVVQVDEKPAAPHLRLGCFHLLRSFRGTVLNVAGSLAFDPDGNSRSRERQ